MVKTTNKTKCPHRNILPPPPLLGEDSPSCADCGEPVACPHPLSERQTAEMFEGDVTTCGWCGHQFD